MRLFSCSFPKKRAEETFELYFRCTEPGTEKVRLLSDQTLCLPPGSKLTTDTYLNSFSESSYYKYCACMDYHTELLCSGHGIASLFYCGADQQRQQIGKSVSFHSEQPISIHLPIKPIQNSMKNGIYYIQLEALEENVIWYQGAYYADATPQQHTRLAIVTCTYHRESWIQKNMQVFLTFLKQSNLPASLFIVDNGQTLSSIEQSHSQIQIILNANTGGSGGFTRGMQEVLASSNSYTHVLLMDDDINILPVLYEKIITFLMFCKTSYSNLVLGGSMLDMERPYLQFESGAYCRNRQLIGIHPNLDMRQLTHVLQNESAPKPDYNSWWCCCIPVQLIRKTGKPLPMFIKFDDVEYALRGKFSILVPNGICVWHENFDKKYNPALEYYIKRNSLITYAIHDAPCSRLNMLRVLWADGIRQIFLQRYFCADLILRAYEDFLKGPSFLENTNSEQLNQDILSVQPKQILIEHPLTSETANLSKWKQVLFLGGLLLPNRYQQKEPITLPLQSACTAQCFGKKHIFHQNPYTHYGFETTLKKKTAFQLIGKLFKTTWHCIWKKRKVEQAYRKKVQDKSMSFD